MVSPPSQPRAILARFRAQHKPQFLDVGLDRWEFVHGGQGEPKVLVIPGSGGTAESMFPVQDALESSTSVVSVGIPASVVDVDPAIHGINAILGAVQARQAVLLGHSLGGMVAQAFAARHPERVAGLALANTGFYRDARGVWIPWVAGIMAQMPPGLLARMVASQMDRLLRSVEEPDFWKDFYGREISGVDAGLRLQGQTRLMVNLLRYFRRNPILSSHSWTQSVPAQILSSADDRGFTGEEKRYLESLYPEARTTHFPQGTGHLSFLTRPSEYSGAVLQLVNQVRSAASN